MDRGAHMKRDPAQGFSPAPWRSAAWRAHLHDVVLGGRRTHYLDIGEGPAVLLVHGLASGWVAWFCNIPELAANYRVIAVDLPGFGRSESLAGPVDIRHYVEAIVQLLDHLDVGEVRIVGHSMGGLVAHEFAAANPERTAALVVVASGGRLHGIQDALFRGLAVGSAVLSSMPRPLIRRAVLGAMAVKPVRELMIGRVVHDSAVVPRKLATHMVSAACYSRGMSDAIHAALSAVRRQDGRRITCPTLVVGGGRDRLVSQAALKYFAVAIPSARCEVLPAAGHVPMFEQPAAFNALLHSFLDEVAAA
jgi:pimeloyl-ACP methyl ester carboxylesterase